MKILILKPSSLGDVVQAIPVARLLKLHRPDSEIYWWIERSLVSLFERDRDIAGVIEFDRKRWAIPWHYGDIWRCVAELRSRRFDLVIDLQALARSAAVAWLANGEFTIGLQDWREGAPGFYDASVPRPSPTTHAVDWYLEVLRRLDVPVHLNFEWLPRNVKVAAEVEALWPTDGSRWIALQPGARWLNKRWPVESFAEVIQRVRRADPEIRFVIFGTKSETAVGRTLAASDPVGCLDLTGRTTLPQMIEWIRRAELMVTNDTGPMHIAAALGKPVVGLFGPTNPLRTGPYRQLDRVLQRHDLACVPCLKDYCSYRDPLACLRGIMPQQVAVEVLSRTARVGTSPRDQ